MLDILSILTLESYQPVFSWSLGIWRLHQSNTNIGTNLGRKILYFSDCHYDGGISAGKLEFTFPLGLSNYFVHKNNFCSNLALHLNCLFSASSPPLFRLFSASSPPLLHLFFASFLPLHQFLVWGNRLTFSPLFQMGIGMVQSQFNT